MIKKPNSVREQMYADLRWAVHDSKLQERFAGKLVVIHKGKFLAAGDDEAALIKEVAGPEHPEHELVVVEIPSLGFEIPPDMLSESN